MKRPQEVKDWEGAVRYEDGKDENKQERKARDGMRREWKRRQEI